MRAALYIRVSTEEQVKEGFSIQGQKERLKDFVKSQGWTIHKFYKDEGYSAKNLNRPAMQELMNDIRNKQFDVVLVYKLDRMVRSVLDLYELLSLFDENSVHFKSSTEMFDTTTANGRMFITLVAAMAQWEREQLAERTVFGMERKFKEGQRNGGKAPYGYTLDENNKLIIDEKEAKWVRWLFDKVSVKGKKSLAKELNNKGIRTRTNTMWNASMVDYILNNPVYYGHLRWNYRKKKGTRTYEEIVVPGDHEAIIDEITFKDVQKQRRERKGKGFKGHSTYPFTSVLKCHRCGNNLVGGKRKRADGSEYRFYKCNGRFVYGTCDLPIIGEPVIEEEFMKHIEYIELEPEIPEEETVNKKEVEQQLKRIENRMERLKELYIDGDIDKKEYREKLELEKEKESEMIQTLQTSNEVVNPQEIIEYIRSIPSEWSHFELDQRKKIIQSIFSSISVEVLQSHTGGKGKKTLIDITDYSLV